MAEDNIQQQNPEENKNDKIWWYLLLGLLQDSTESKWLEYTKQLMYSNRFSSSHEVIDLVCSVGDIVSKTITKGTQLYRARIFHKEPLESFIGNLFESTSTDSKLTFSKNIMLYPLIGLLSEGKEAGKHYEIIDRFKKEYSKWQAKAFKGYSADESNKPPNDKAAEGRVNPELISYLYLSEDPLTCVYEVRPAIGQNVSVATFEIKKDLRIYDFAYSFPNDFKNEKQLDIALFDYISKQFSLPYQNKPLQYLPTQYLGEVIKNSGFDGLRFQSSLHQNGYNIVLFDNQFCEAVSSDYITVQGINLTFSNPDMYELGEIVTSIDASDPDVNEMPDRQ